MLRSIHCTRSINALTRRSYRTTSSPEDNIVTASHDSESQQRLPTGWISYGNLKVKGSRSGSSAGVQSHSAHFYLAPTCQARPIDRSLGRLTAFPSQFHAASQSSLLYKVLYEPSNTQSIPLHGLVTLARGACSWCLSFLIVVMRR
jgi:hypothetical protein